MTSTRAAEVAEVLWELKRADKLATLTTIARRAGFSAGSNGRAVLTTLKTVRKGWPHLQWWRAVNDDGKIEKGCEQEVKLRECGYEIVQSDGKTEVMLLKSFEQHLMQWEDASAESGVETAKA
jgi:alkylated DNA nucleotide flippase Atl1